MRDEYDFESMDARPNPYAARLKKSVTIRLDRRAIDYFKSLAEENGIPYQSLINLYLVDCMEKKRRIDLDWKE